MSAEEGRGFLGSSRSAPPTEPAPEESASTSEESPYPETGGKEYKFTSHARDFGDVSPVGSLITHRGEVIRGETIELSDEEVADLRKGGARFSEVKDGEE